MNSVQWYKVLLKRKHEQKRKVKLISTSGLDKTIAVVLPDTKKELELKRRRELYKKNKDRINLLRRKLYVKNRDKILEQCKERYRMNKGKIDTNKWYHNNPDKVKAYRNRPDVKARRREYKRKWYQENKKLNQKGLKARTRNNE
jgi:hypothetical protein